MFETLEHTADIGIRVRGATLGELLANASLGLQAVALDPEEVQPRESYPVEACGEDVEALVVNWLNEVVYLLDGRRVCFARVEVDETTHLLARGRVWGEPRDNYRHPTRLVVKAATYHELRVTQEHGGWLAEIYLDI